MKIIIYGSGGGEMATFVEMSQQQVDDMMNALMDDRGRFLKVDMGPGEPRQRKHLLINLDQVTSVSFEVD